MRYFVFSGIFLLAVALGAVAQDLPDVDQFGPQLGDVVPAFSLPDQSGQAQTVESIMGPQGAMLVFSRSADW